MDEEHWTALHEKADGIFVADCWKHCGSYCCKTNHAVQDFSLMKCGSAGMVFPLREYEFLKRNGLLQDGFENTARHWEYKIDAERDLTIRFVTAHCDLGGLCSNAKWRPLICKFYPLYPRVAAEGGAVESYTFGSIIDQYWDELGIEHPCWLYRNHGDEIDKTIRQTLADVLSHPYLIFYLGAASIFVEHVARLREGRELALDFSDPRQFFRVWEVSYLTGQLIDQDVLRAELVSHYDAIAAHHGPFDL